MTRAPVCELAHVDLALVDDPALPARASIDETKLEELAQSIRALGLIEPLALKRVGPRFEVIAGHRRRLASLRAGLVSVPAMIYPDDARILEAVKLHENTKREDLNPAEEAIYFAQLFETLAGNDFDALCTLLEETPSYVNSRMDLLRGDEAVFAALLAGKLTLTAAQELNRIRDAGQRANLLGVAVSQGANARMVREWRLAAERSAAGVGESTTGADGSATPIAATDDDPLACFFCGSREDFHQKVLVYFDPACLKAVERMVGVRLRHVFREPDDSAAPAPGKG